MKIKLPKSMDSPTYVQDMGFVSQWCCKCGNRHIMFMRICKGNKATNGDYIEINWMQDDLGTKLRKYYEKKTAKKGKK